MRACEQDITQVVGFTGVATCQGFTAFQVNSPACQQRVIPYTPCGRLQTHPLPQDRLHMRAETLSGPTATALPSWPQRTQPPPTLCSWDPKTPDPQPPKLPPVRR